MRFDLMIDPDELPTAQQKGVTRYGQVYTKRKVWTAKQRLIAELLRVSGMEEKVRKPDWASAWSVEATFVYVRSVPNRQMGGPKRTRPDVDNLAKLLLDAVSASAIAFKDDGQVADLFLHKRFARKGEQAHIELEMEVLG